MEQNLILHNYQYVRNYKTRNAHDAVTAETALIKFQQTGAAERHVEYHPVLTIEGKILMCQNNIQYSTTQIEILQKKRELINEMISTVTDERRKSKLYGDLTVNSWALDKARDRIKDAEELFECLKKRMAN